MAYQQTQKMSDLDKRLEAIKRELYGKEPKISIKQKAIQTVPISEKVFQNKSSYKTLETEDLKFLQYDLRKIVFLAIAALSFQILLYLQINGFLIKFG